MPFNSLNRKINFTALLSKLLSKDRLEILNLKDSLLSRIKMSFGPADWLFLGLTLALAVFVFAEIIYSLFMIVIPLFQTTGNLINDLPASLSLVAWLDYLKQVLSTIFISLGNSLNLSFIEVFLQIFGIVLLVTAFFIWGVGVLRSFLTYSHSSKRKSRTAAWLTLFTCMMLFLISIVYF